MRDTFEWIDAATDKDEQLRHALYDLAAHQIATQAFAVACATLSKMSKDQAATLVENVAGYPGVTGRSMTPGSPTRVAQRATEILLTLGRMKQGFAPPLD